MANGAPQKFGDYYLLDKIAVGGMAEIWRAKTIGLEGFERVVAIKFILSNYTQNPEFNSMFIEEARIASTLNHSNIVRITNFGVIDGRYYHEMEFIDGKNVRQIFQKCKDTGTIFPVDSVCSLISEVCKGLHYVHTKHDPFTNEPLNIIHRDVSPQNIIVSYEGETKILDWGIAKAKGKMDETRAGILKGKFGYMSPEQAEGEELDARTDIFSAGVCFYELVTGERLFVADNEINTLKKIRECNIPLPSKVNPLIDAELEAIIMKSLARYRIERYQNCYDMHEDLIKYLHKKYPSYTSIKLSRHIKEVFTKEIIEERKRVNEQEHSVSSYSSLGYSSGSYEEKTKISSGESSSSANFTMASSGNVSDRDKTLLTDRSKNKNSEQEATGARTVVDPSYTGSKTYEVPQAVSDRAKETSYKPEPIIKHKKFSLYGNGKRRTLVRSLILGGALILILYALLGDSDKAGQVKEPRKAPEEVPVTQSVQETLPPAPVAETEPIPAPTATPEVTPVAEPTPAPTPSPEQVVDQYASLHLSTVPASASVFIDGVYQGRTPINLDRLDVGKRYKLELKAEGYNSVSKFFTLRKAEANKLDFGMSPVNVAQPSGKSYLSFEVQPPVKIYVDGTLVSNFRSLYMYEIEPGNHTIRLVNDKQDIDTTVDVNIPKGEHIKKDITLR